MMISSDAKITSRDYKFYSGQSIEFLAGFEIILGRTFEADIRPCNPPALMSRDDLDSYMKSLKELEVKMKSHPDLYLDSDDDGVIDLYDKCPQNSECQ